MLTTLQSKLLQWISPGEPCVCTGSAYEGKSKLAVLLGDEFVSKIAGKVIIDFGCGDGSQAFEMAGKGARRAIGIDIREDVLESARTKAADAGVQDTCLFASSTEERADFVVSLDAFEHFANPAEILRTMYTLLRPAGEVLVSFGPTWFHPLGGHLFSVFPWAHLLFSEKALIGWRSRFKNDGATNFAEVSGGLNQMTIANFVQLVNRSPLRFAALELVPIRKLRRLHNRFTREFTTAIVRCRLVSRS